MAKPLASKKLNGMNYLAWKHVLQFFLRENWHKIQEHEVWNCEDAIVMWAGIGVWLMVIRTEECPMQFDMQTVCKYPLKLILSSPRIPTLHDSEKSQKWNWDLSYDWDLAVHLSPFATQYHLIIMIDLIYFRSIILHDDEKEGHLLIATSNYGCNTHWRSSFELILQLLEWANYKSARLVFLRIWYAA